MQKLFITGMVSKDAELRHTQGGDDVLSITVVCSNGKDKSGNWRDGTFYECDLWGKRAATLAPHITKGKYLSLVGRPKAREYSGKAYLGMSVDELDFAGEKVGRQQSAPRDQGGNYGGDAGSSGYGSSGYGAGGVPDDEIPFAPQVL